MNTASGVLTRRTDLIRFLQSFPHQVTVIACADSAVADLARIGVRFREWPVRQSSLNPFRECLALLRLRRLLLSLNPDIILCFTPKAILLGSLAARVTPTAHTFSIFAGLGHLFGSDKALIRVFAPAIRLLFRLALRNNAIVFFQNPDDLMLFAKTRIVLPERAHRLYGSGVDLKRFCPSPARTTRHDTVFLMIARLIAAKGVLDYIEAARILKREEYHTHFRLLGPFEEHPTAIDKGTIQRAVAAGLIEYCGTTRDIRPYLQAADVFVLPSYYREGTPRSALEALAMAKPIITTDSPGCRETVVHDSNGYMVPPRNPSALADAMLKLSADHSQMRKMGENSRRLAEEYYDVDKVNAHLWSAITRQINAEPST